MSENKETMCSVCENREASVLFTIVKVMHVIFSYENVPPMTSEPDTTNIEKISALCLPCALGVSEVTGFQQVLFDHLKTHATEITIDDIQ